MKWPRVWPFLAAALVTLLVFRIASLKLHASVPERRAPFVPHIVQDDEPKTPFPDSSPHHHPIKQLEQEALHSFESLINSQTKSLKDAVREYRRRYGIHPPPLFDKWHDFARRRGLQLTDEFDAIYDSLLPFWALEPLSIRSRVQEALGYEPNGLIALQVRNGQVARMDGGPEWQMTVMKDMIKEFVHLLPDMDLAFNLHDEPRIVVPHDELAEMVRIAKDKAIARTDSKEQIRNSFSPRPSDVNDGKRRIRLTSSSRFNEYQHQSVWVPSRLSCSPRSRARDFRDGVEDDTHEYLLGQLGFVYNHTALSDICSSPSLRGSFGFFQRANAFKVSHELIPIFSESKLSSFQDILYPNPWYYYGKIVTDQPANTHEAQYDEALDEEWDAKADNMWWRGSTTGGFSREGGWRHHHRQNFVSKINAVDADAKVLVNKSSSSETSWRVQEVPRSNYSQLVDIHFTGVGQCDPGDCDAQREYFDLAPPVSSQEAWKHKLLLDIDGNAFSGRFYSFLRSKSLPLKLSIFREWHQDWLVPWVHYVPLSLQGDEHLETVRYLTTDEQGKQSASRMASQGRAWAKKALRNEDLEIWFFRLLLEYARVIDDNRESIGFTL